MICVSPEIALYMKTVQVPLQGWFGERSIYMWNKSIVDLRLRALYMYNNTASIK